MKLIRQTTAPMGQSPLAALSRHRRLLFTWAAAVGAGVLKGCSPKPHSFSATDITGATFAQGLRLKDHEGKERSLADFKGKAVVVFFGFTQCPDVCPPDWLSQSALIFPAS